MTWDSILSAVKTTLIIGRHKRTGTWNTLKKVKSYSLLKNTRKGFLMIIKIDIDDTLMTSNKTNCPCCGRANYSNAKPIQSEIDLLNKLYYNGHTIILLTGRNWDCYDFTKKQAEEMGIKFHDLQMGRRPGIYVDKTECIKSLEELSL